MNEASKKLNPSGLCECGCGGQTPLAKQHRKNLGHVKGEPVRFIQGHQPRRTPFDYIVDPVTGCWIYQQGISNWGYGAKQCPRRKRQTSAHVVYYERAYGPRPEGTVIDHMCHNEDPTCPGGKCMHRRCVNPAHLRAVTNAVNVVASDRGPVAANKAKTHCDRGHEFNAENTYWRPDRTGRNCKACKRIRDSEKARQKALQRK